MSARDAIWAMPLNESWRPLHQARCGYELAVAEQEDAFLSRDYCMARAKHWQAEYWFKRMSAWDRSLARPDG